MTDVPTRLGLSLPFADVSLADHRPLLRRLVEAGYDQIWSGEVDSLDGHTPLALFAGWEPSIGLSSAVSSVFTRGPGVLAMTAASMAEVAPGRVRFGIGAGSHVIASWNGVPFERPYQKTADTLRFLREVLGGGRASDYPTVHAAGFRLTRPPEQPPELMLAALGPRMQELAAAEADSVVFNFLSAADVRTIRAHAAGVIRTAANPLEVTARIFVVPGAPDAAEDAARRQIAGYLTVPVYANYQTWLGRGPQLLQMQDAWAAGERKEATRVIPEQVLRELVIWGSVAECAAQVQAYVDAGLDAITLFVLPSAKPMPPARRVQFLIDLAGLVRLG